MGARVGFGLLLGAAAYAGVNLARDAALATAGRGRFQAGRAYLVQALLGGFVGSAVFGWDVTGINIGSIVLAFVGAVLFLLVLRMIPGRQPFER